METISKKCIVYKKNDNDVKVVTLELTEYHGMFVREVSGKFEVFLDYKGYCINVGTFDSDSELEEYKEEFESVCLDKVNALRRLRPNNRILELFKLTNENELYKEFFARRTSIFAEREKREKEFRDEREKMKKLEEERAKKDNEELIKTAINKWKNKEEISNIEFLELCKLNNISIHPRTLHFIQESLSYVSGDRREYGFKNQVNSKGRRYTPKCNNFCNVLDELSEVMI